MTDWIAKTLAISLALGCMAGHAAAQGTEAITLDDAIAAALDRSPVVGAQREALGAADARVQQAGLHRNPELEVEMENFGGPGELSGFGSAETAFLVSQPLELGAKRSRRRSAAEALRDVVARDAANTRLWVRARTSADFFRALAAEDRVTLSEELVQLAERLLEAVTRRVEAGKVSPTEATRARVPLATSRITLRRTQGELHSARVQLASNWGDDGSRLGNLVGALDDARPAPPLAVVLDRLPTTPELARWDDEIRLRELEVRVERSLAIPDLTITAGPRYSRELGSTAWVAAVGVDLPIFNRNAGAVRAAEHEVQGAREQRRAAGLALHSRVTAARETLATAYSEVRLLAAESVPAAVASFAAVEIGYLEGKLGILDVLDAHSTLFETRLQLLDAQERYHLACIELERLAGGPLNPDAEIPTDHATGR